MSAADGVGAGAERRGGSMTIGLISDVHANVIALGAALEALKRRRVDTILCLGDLVGYGPAPNEAIDLIRSEGIECTLGASDERLAFGFISASKKRHGVADEILSWTRGVLEPSHLAFLQGLPVQKRIQTPAGWLRFFHGTVDNTSERLNLNQDPHSLTRMLERHRCSILASGATHVPFFRRVGPNGLVVNPGSVGLSLNGEPGADYALLTVSEDSVEIEMDKVEYDFAAVAFEIVAWGISPMVAEAVQMGRLPEKLAGGMGDGPA
ncbi:MAG TPA: metallophosphoesterase family protein [Trueperaceae bacterium]|nr:metallophosphoesterase family protein [Trueperaceae bacterium]